VLITPRRLAYFNMNVSTNYQALTPEQVSELAQKLDGAWKNPRLPKLQYDMVVATELQNYKRGRPVAPYEVFIELMKAIPGELGKYPDSTLLDVGASSGYYREVLRENSLWCTYTACDYSEDYQRLAKQLYPAMTFDVADARNLPYQDASFDIVYSGACLMHVYEYEKVIAELARVASQYVLLHRNPVHPKPTEFFTKEAYGIETLEAHFNESELEALFPKYGLSIVKAVDVFRGADGFGHRSYLLKCATT
jgi:SAM-dependent methyltransferase